MMSCMCVQVVMELEVLKRHPLALSFTDQRQSHHLLLLFIHLWVKLDMGISVSEDHFHY